MQKKPSSQIPNFHKNQPNERIRIISEQSHLTTEEQTLLSQSSGITLEQANNMTENTIGVHGLPIGIATNFLINNRDYLIPMVIEEPSVVAAASNAAKLFRTGYGFKTYSDEPIMIGQIQVLDIKDIQKATERIQTEKDNLLKQVNNIAGSILKRGGGARDIQVREIHTKIGTMFIIHLLYDVRDAMGANAINTAVEHIAPTIESLTGGRVNLRILSNLSDQRKAYAEGMIPSNELAKGNLCGEDAVKAIVEAGDFAEADPYRATTHNKGIMNGIDAVVIATGNDWRAVEAAAHAYAARGGSYTSLTKWWQDESGNLRGSIELPMAVGIVGGATQVHPSAQIALKILGVESARELAEVIAAVGLAQNFAAIRALATEGIQQGHMRMHARQLAVAAGAPTDIVGLVTEQMITEGNIRLERAKEIVQKIQQGNNS